MTGAQAIAYIHSLLPFGIKPGLERIAALCEALGNPQNELRFIHVAGTNGKGSTCTMLARVLQKAGLRTGLFTSPYVTDFRERIRCNGTMIPPDALGEAVGRVQAAAVYLAQRGIQITEFEALTAAAFLYFRQARCDIVVLEVGLGGRFDATNIIPCPLLSVITCISTDHTAILGDTLAQIAAEKCGILKPGGRTVSYAQQASEALQVIRQQAQIQNNTLCIPPDGAAEICGESPKGTDISYMGSAYHVPFMGRHMVQNALTVITCVQELRRLGLHIPQTALQQGIACATMPARMELCDGVNPPVLIDGGHNSGCADALAQVLRRFWSGKNMVFVCAMMADKDAHAYLETLAPLATHLYATAVPMERALPPDTLAAVAQACGIPCAALPDTAAALREAMCHAGSNGLVVVCGSFYLAAALRESILSRREVLL